MSFTKVKLKEEQFATIRQLSKELKISENEIASFFVEMGIGYVIAWRKGKDESSLSEMAKQMEESPVLNRLGQRLEAFWDAGQ